MEDRISEERKRVTLSFKANEKEELMDKGREYLKRMV